MTTPRTAVAAVAVVAAGAAVAIPLFTADASATSSQSFTVVAEHVSETSIDNGAKGFSAGDLDVHTDRLTENGSRVGWQAGSCLTTRATASSADELCQLVLHLPHGQIVASGAVRAGQQGPGTFALAITGGTGRYAAARGSLSMTASDASSIPIKVNVRY